MPSLSKGACGMGMTAAEKILAAASGTSRVRPGDHLRARPNRVVFHDAAPAATYDWFDDNGFTVWDPDRVIVVFDHFLRTRSVDRARRFCRDHRIAHVFDVGRHGLSHQIPAEAGLVVPGTLVHNFDTMASTMGGLGCVTLAGTGDSEYVAALGEMWLRVPESVQVRLEGSLAPGVSVRDLFAVVRRDLADIAASRILEFSGPGVAGLSIDSRMALCNGAVVMGAVTALVEPDQRTIDYVRSRTDDPFECLVSDPDAEFAASVTFDLGAVTPMVSVPPSPESVVPLEDVRGIRIDQAYLGSCASGRLEDLTIAAGILDGQTIAPGVRLIVTPISSEVLAEASRQGLIKTLVEAGATVTTPGCGACWIGNQSPGELADGEVCISTSTENSPGRMGSASASIYLASPAVVAASAIAGRIADPRDVLVG